MTMGSHCMQFTHSRRLFFIYAFVVFTIFFYMVGYSPKSYLMTVMKWPQTQIITSAKTIPCLPKTNIVFLKTHKCASTSVQNILMRYAHENDLTLVLPVSPKVHLFSQVKPFKKEMVAGAPWEILSYNILCHHMIFSKDAIEKLMPKDSVYISIIRNPIHHFESLYEYNNMQDFYHMDIEEYARGTKNVSIIPKLKNRSRGMGQNQMLFDFGVHPSFFNNRAMLAKAIKKIDNNFDFIMISEYFDESIVLLRHILCWDLDDVISLTKNARTDNYRRNLSAEAIKLLEEWNWGDKLLYDHFVQKFKDTVKEFGEERLDIEVKELREKRNQWFDYCIQEKVEAKKLKTYEIANNKVEGYVLKSGIKNNTCEDFAKPEIYFTSELRQHQLIRSILKGAALPNYGPTSLRRLLDLKFLKGKELAFAKNLSKTHFKYRNKFSASVNSKKVKNN